MATCLCAANYARIATDRVAPALLPKVRQQEIFIPRIQRSAIRRIPRLFRRYRYPQTRQSVSDPGISGRGPTDLTVPVIALVVFEYVSSTFPERSRRSLAQLVNWRWIGAASIFGAS